MERAVKTLRLIPALVLIQALLACGCEPRDSDVLREFPAPRLAAQTPELGQTQRFVVAPGATLSVGLGTKREPLKLSLQGITGHLEVSPLRLRELRGELRADLRTLRVVEGAISANRALEWLDVDSESRRSRDRYAKFVVHSVSELSVEALHLAPSRHTSEGAFMEASVTVLGALELHGYRVEQAVDLLLRVPVVDQAPNLAKLKIRTARPARIDLAAHHIFALPDGATGSRESPLRTAGMELELPLLAVE